MTTVARYNGKPFLLPVVALIIGVLVLAALTNGYIVPLAGRRARPEHIVGPIVFVLFLLYQLARRERPVRVDVFAILAGGWVAVNGVSSWLYAPQPLESLVHVVRMAILVAIFLTIANLPLRRAAEWLGAVQWWLTLGLAGLMYGLLSWLLAQYADVWLPGAFINPTLAGISIQGMQMERNLFGICAGVLLLVVVYVFLAQRGTQNATIAPPPFLACSIALAGIVTTLSLTRSAWLAVVAASPLAYVVFDRRRPRSADRPLLHCVVGLPVLMAGLIAVMQVLPAPPVADESSAGRNRPVVNLATGDAMRSVGDTRQDVHGASSALNERLSTFANLRSDMTTSTRIQDAKWAVAIWMESPLLGHGTGAFGQIYGVRVGTEAWISNLILHTMADTGLVGLAIQISLFALVAWRSWRLAQLTPHAGLAIGLKALTLALVGMLIAYQLTDGTWLAVFWIHLGLMVSGIYCVQDERRRAAA